MISTSVLDTSSLSLTKSSCYTVNACQEKSADTIIIKEYTYRAGERDSEQDAKLLALNGAKRLVLEEVGSYLQSEISVRKTEIRSLGEQDLIEFTSQRIRNVTAGIIQSEILESRWDGYTYYIRARFVLNPEKIFKQIQELATDAPRLRALDSLQALNDSIVLQNRILNEQIQTQSIAEVRAVLNETRRDRVKKLVVVNDQMSSLLRFEEDIRGIVVEDLIKKGRGLVTDGYYKEAETILSRAIEGDPQAAAAFYWRSAARRNGGDTLGAFVDIQKAIALGFEEPLALYYYAFGLAERTRHNEAADAFKRALSARFTNSKYLFSNETYEQNWLSTPNNIGRWGFALLQAGEAIRAMNVCAGGIDLLAEGWSNARTQKSEMIQSILDAPDTLRSDLKDTLPELFFQKAVNSFPKIGFDLTTVYCFLEANSQLMIERQDGLFGKHAVQAATALLYACREGMFLRGSICEQENLTNELLLKRSLANIVTRDWPTVFADTRRLLRDHPTNSAGLAIAAVGYGRTNRWKLADSLSAIALASERNAFTLHVRGWAQRSVGDYATASRTLQEAIAAEPRNGEAYFDYVVTKYCLGKRTGLIDELTAALNTATKGREWWVAQAYHFRARLKDEQGNRSGGERDRALGRDSQSRFPPGPEEEDPQWWVDYHERQAVQAQERGEVSQAGTYRQDANRYRAQMRPVCVTR